MCGIVGVSGQYDRDRFERALSRLAHRGPDDVGSYESHGRDCMLGHRRLAIIDTSAAGHQPMISHCGRFVIAFNGEIYNFKDLRARAETRGVAFRSSSDTEVLLELFVTLGPECLGLLNGMFAFAVYDMREQTLFLTRDQSGIKPLYYFHVGGRFGFASELKALVPLLPSAPTLDPVAINRYLRYLWCPGAGTPFQEIRKLRPGEVVVARQGSVLSRYRYSGNADSSCDRHDTDPAEELREELDAAVQRQLVSDVPVGSFLSGGLDSSAVVAFAARHTPNIACYTIEQEGGEDVGVESDLPYAIKVARHLGVPLEIVKLRASGLRDNLSGLVAQLDEPQADPAALAVQAISSQARAQGVKVLLSGIGGDDLFAGYRRHQAIYWASRVGTMPAWARTGLRRIVRKLDHRSAWVRQLARLVDSSSTDIRTQMVGLFGWTPDGVAEKLFADPVRQLIDDESSDKVFWEFLRGSAAQTDVLKEALSLEQEFFLPDHNLAYADKMSMSEGVEIRVPILDRTIVELSHRIAGKDLMRRGVAKSVLKRAMKGVLPDEVINRKKVGFGAPVRRWIRGDLRDLVQDCLSSDRLRARGLFDERRIGELISRNEIGETDSAYTILALVCVELWLQHYIDGDFAWRAKA